MLNSATICKPIIQAPENVKKTNSRQKQAPRILYKKNAPSEESESRL